MTANPLLIFNELPHFSEINAGHIEPAVSVVLRQNKEQLRQLLQDSRYTIAPTWASLMSPLDDMEDRLSKVWSTVSHLNAVMNTPEIRAAYNKCQPMITEYYTGLGQNRELFEAVRLLADSAEDLGLDQSQRKILRDSLLDFRLAGVDLDDDKKKAFAELETRLSNLANKFSNNVLDATMAWTLQITDRDRLAGVPEATVQAAAETAKSKSLDGYVLTLDFPCYNGVMTNADDRELRQQIYRAFVSRASDQSAADEQWDNKSLIDEILTCRSALAKLLGYSSYAEVSIARKMAKSVATVNLFLEDLAELAVPAARKEYEELRGFAARMHGIEDLAAWDISYYSEKLRKQNFDISQEELREYFPIPKVKSGLFEIARLIYGVGIRENTQMSKWHDSVTAYDITRDGDVIARFYLDLFTRDGKKSGAWMAECRSRRLLPDGDLQIPVAYLVCNFGKGSGTKPALLTHNEVTTLFHEFGHGLHHMLTAETHLRSSGINGVAWDAVELPSQLMENWCWDSRAIEMISEHFETGASLPAEVLRRMLAARNFQSGMKTVRQLEFAMFDFQMHQLAGNVDGDQVQKKLTQVRALTSAYTVPPYNRFQNSFSHIFAGGYAAGYYSYKWAEVLSADVFSRFVESGVFNSDTGSEFLDKVLSRGGGADPLALFTHFMGREPSIDALLRQDGLLG